jgi:HK97 gp10 family phage protein
MVKVVSIEGGPELARKLQAIEKSMSATAAREALLAGGRVIADAWAARVPVEDENYRHEMQQEDVVRASANFGSGASGARGTVGPRRRPGLENPVLHPGETKREAQPANYAARLEFGDHDRKAEPSARPAFDASSDAAVEAVGNTLRAALARFTS